MPSELIKKTNYSLYFVRFSTEDILKIINSLDSSKAHGHDAISIRMLRICGSSVCRPLQIIYKSFLNRRKLPQERKKANVVPIHDFDERIKRIFEKTSKSISLIRQLRNFLPRPSLLQIYKSFVRPYLGYGDIIC